MFLEHMLRNWHININRLRQIPESKGKQKTKKKKNQRNRQTNKKSKKSLQNHPKIKLEEVFSIYTASMV